MFANYLELTMNLILSLLLNTPPSLIDVHQCLGKVLGALITTLGPELQGCSMSFTIRVTFILQIFRKFNNDS